jgi:hypothetical protein
MPSQLAVKLNSTPGAGLEMDRSKVPQHPVLLTTDHNTASHLQFLFFWLNINPPLLHSLLSSGHLRVVSSEGGEYQLSVPSSLR